MSTDTTHLLQIYCDLDERYLDCLRQAAAGTLTHMHGAMRERVAVMIGPDHRLTEYGEEVLERAENIMLGIAPITFPVEYIFQPAFIASQLRRAGHRWITSAHVKVLCQLRRWPGLSCKYLCGVFGYSTMGDLIEHDLVSGAFRIGWPFTVSEAGKNLVLDYERDQPAREE